MVQLFCDTHGASNDVMSSLVGLMYRSYAFADMRGVLGDFSTADVARIASDIRENGFHVFRRRLSDSLCDELLHYATTAPCIRRATDGDERTDVNVENYPRLNPDAVRYDFDVSHLINNSHVVQRLMADRSFLGVAQSYLQAQPIMDLVGMWWNATSPQPDKLAAQFWHFDMDRIKWIKFFVYLTDVGPENGPHSFVTGSHRRGGIPIRLLQKGYARLTDEEVSSVYSKDRLVEFTAPRGTVIAEDTRGLHKGKHLTKDDRLILQLQYSNSLFGANYPRQAVCRAVPELAAMISRYPRLYSQYS
jgi:hypothetical protein